MDKYLLRRYFLFVLALFINAFGISFITRALLGTSPITSVTYVLSMFTSLTMGQWTMIVNIAFVLLELPFMTKEIFRRDRRLYLLQIPISLCFGFFIDFGMYMLSWVHPDEYIGKIAFLLAGCVVLAVGIALEVKANVAMTSGEYFVMAISSRLKKDFGYVKLGFDVTLVILAVLVSLIFMSGIYGVREGTVIAALLVGPIVHVISPFYRSLDKFLSPSGAHQPVSQVEHPAGNVVITIAREFGSGGRVLGQMLSRELGIKVYDSEFISLAAKRIGMDEEFIRKNEQSIPAFWLKCVTAQNSGIGLESSLSPDDVLFVAESRIIQDLAAHGPCIIVGRCADFVLGDNPELIKVFCCSDIEKEKERCINVYGIPADKAESEIRRTNRNRAIHYEYYTGEKWGDAHHYNLVVNTASIGLQTACSLVAALYREKSNQL